MTTTNRYQDLDWIEARVKARREIEEGREQARVAHEAEGCDEDCVPCARCLHNSCAHRDSDGDCQEATCHCPRWLTASDCFNCDGWGSWWVESPDGRQEAEIVCPDCRGTGAFYADQPVDWYQGQQASWLARSVHRV